MSRGRAEIYSPERGDESLGDGWQWSERHLCQVNSERYKLYLQADALWFKLRKSNQAAVCITEDDEPEDFPVIKMVMLTHSPEAISSLTETFIS